MVKDIPDLFEHPESTERIPLAEKARPEQLGDIIGQEKILGEGTILRGMIENGDYSSFILWGPPGTGKTTIAKLIEKTTTQRFVSFSAVLSGIAEVKAVMKEADYNLKMFGRRTIVFVDEIHRFNKSQQDAFLPYVESGAIILLGATTENPSFEVIPALLSRCHVFVLESLDEADLCTVIGHAADTLNCREKFAPDAVRFIASISGGDGRKALNFVDMIVRQNPGAEAYPADTIRKVLTRKSMFYDKGGEEHYNLISALHKSLRGSDPQAGLYWLCRMIESGEDPMYIVRRLTRFASEDVGLADPNALVQAIAVRDTLHFVGMPEAGVALAQLVVYLATAPKSNALDVAWGKALESARKTGHLGVPMVIRNAPTRLMKSLGYGRDYAYSHDYRHHYYYQKHFPDKMAEEAYYEPSPYGFEKDIRKRLDWWRKLREEQEKSEGESQ